MAEFEITADLRNVVFSPSSEIQEIIQNVRTIISTRKGNVPLDRDFGLDWGFVDQPLAVSQAMLSAEVVRQVKKYEPRAVVIRVGFDPSSNAADGQLKPIVVIGVNA
jgi:phage baseplate assembly protein W